MNYFVVIEEIDNVATAVSTEEQGATIQTNHGHSIVLLNPIQLGHKVAIKDITKNEPVIKYGETICLAKRDIKIGEHVHIHNIIDILTDKVEAWKLNGI
jgi:hypothetical protein